MDKYMVLLKEIEAEMIKWRERAIESQEAHIATVTQLEDALSQLLVKEQLLQELTTGKGGVGS